MNIKKMKSFIKEKANNVEINDYRKSILSKVEDISYSEIVTYNKNKRYLRPIIAFASICILAFGTFATVDYFVNYPSRNYIEGVSKAKELLSYEVSALGNIMASESITSIKRSKAVDEEVETTKENEVEKSYEELLEEAKEYVDEIHSYLITGEMLFNKDNFSAIHETNDDLNYPFEHKLVVTYQENDIFSSNYTMYYDETRKIESDKPLDEVSTYLNGIMIVDNVEYIVKGEKEIYGQSYDTTLTMYFNENSYIKIIQETSKNANEYRYEFVEDGKVEQLITLELDSSILSKEMDIVINKDFQEKRYSFDYYENKINCKYEDTINLIDFRIVIDLYDTYYLYNFNEEIKIEKEK